MHCQHPDDQLVIFEVARDQVLDECLSWAILERMLFIVQTGDAWGVLVPSLESRKRPKISPPIARWVLLVVTDRIMCQDSERDLLFRLVN